MLKIVGEKVGNQRISECVEQTNPICSSRGSPYKPIQSDIKKAYEFRKHWCTPRPTTIAIVDDVIGTGAHFKAIESILLEQNPGIDVIGLILARRILLDAKHTVEHIFSPVDPDG